MQGRTVVSVTKIPYNRAGICMVTLTISIYLYSERPLNCIVQDPVSADMTLIITAAVVLLLASVSVIQLAAQDERQCFEHQFDSSFIPG